MLSYLFACAAIQIYWHAPVCAYMLVALFLGVGFQEFRLALKSPVFTCNFLEFIVNPRLSVS